MARKDEVQQDDGGGQARPRRQRRKDARPSEIVEAAIALFGEHGFGATRLEEVARRAGVAKGTLFVYFPTKQDLFRAVAQTVLATHLDRLPFLATGLDRPLRELVPSLLAQAAMAGESELPRILRMLIAEARRFPELARTWHDEVVAKILGLLSAEIERAQARGEVRPGDPYLHAFSIMGPMLAGVIFREVFGQADARLPVLRDLAAQHARTVLDGLLVTDEAAGGRP